MEMKKTMKDPLKLDRLTERNEFGIDRVCYYPKKMQNMTCYSCLDRTKCNADIFERLAEYEDTGLSPEMVMEYKIFEDYLIKNGITIHGVIELTKNRLEEELK